MHAAAGAPYPPLAAREPERVRGGPRRDSRQFQSAQPIVHSMSTELRPQLPRMAVLIPCFNEELTIAEVVADFRAALPTAEIYVCDNNSTDRSLIRAAAAHAHVFSEPRQGKGYVLQSMFRDIDTDIYVVVDADRTYSAAAAPSLLQPIVDGRADMVIGSRLHPGGRRGFTALHWWGNHFFVFLARLLFGISVTDLLSGYRVLTRAVAGTVRLERWFSSRDRTDDQSDARRIPRPGSSSPPCYAPCRKPFEDSAPFGRSGHSGENARTFSSGTPGEVCRWDVSGTLRRRRVDLHAASSDSAVVTNANRLPLLVALVAVGLTVGGLLLGYEPVGGDPDWLYRPLKTELGRSLREGHLPFWSDRFGLGVPLVAESQVAAFYPPNWILYGGSTCPLAYRLAMWLHYLALVGATYAYARRLGVLPWGCALAAVAFTLCGFQAVHASHGRCSYLALPFLPIALLCADRYVTDGSRVALALLAIVWGAQLTLGNFQLQMWTAALVLLTGGWRIPRGWPVAPPRTRARQRSCPRRWCRRGATRAQLGLRKFRGSDESSDRGVAVWSHRPAHWKSSPAIPRLFQGLESAAGELDRATQRTSRYEAALYHRDHAADPGIRGAGCPAQPRDATMAADCAREFRVWPRCLIGGRSGINGSCSCRVLATSVRPRATR